MCLCFYGASMKKLFFFKWSLEQIQRPIGTELYICVTKLTKDCVTVYF